MDFKVYSENIQLNFVNTKSKSHMAIYNLAFNNSVKQRSETLENYN